MDANQAAIVASMRPPPKEAEYTGLVRRARRRDLAASMRPPPKEAEYVQEDRGQLERHRASMRPPPKEAEYGLSMGFPSGPSGLQ